MTCDRTWTGARRRVTVACGAVRRRPRDGATPRESALGEPVSDTIDLQLDDLAYGGDAVGRYGGQVVFVPLGLPGERVRVTLVRRQKRYARGRIVEIQEPSPQRVAPPCPYYGRCGGCQLQHLSYPGQLEHKRRVVAAQLERIGRQEGVTVLPTLGMEDPWRYRNNVQASLTDEGELGFLAAGSNRVVPVAHCLLLHPLLDDLWAGPAREVALRGAGRVERLSLRAGLATGERLVILEGVRGRVPDLPAEGGASWVQSRAHGAARVLRGKGDLVEVLAGRRLRISAEAFFQVNTAQAEVLVAVAARMLALAGTETLLDAYCGVGTFALTAGRRAGRVIGIESAAGAIVDALANRHEGEPAEFLVGRVEEVLPGVEAHIDAVILDPPRAGCAREVLEALAAREPGRIVYVPCDPATLARDVAVLSEHGYRPEQVQPVDMFPQTYHVETVVLLSGV